jgi:hypothetical protein
MKPSNYAAQSAEEQQVLQRLDALVAGVHVTQHLAPVIERVERRMTANLSSIEEWEPLPVELFGELPQGIRSAWVFILGAKHASGFERHPNSRQRVMSYRGRGDFQVGYPLTSSNHLVSDRGLHLERRWVSIPVNEWHQAVVPDKNWVVVSFHTVPAPELIEERPTDVGFFGTRQRTYVG